LDNPQGSNANSGGQDSN